MGYLVALGLAEVDSFEAVKVVTLRLRRPADPDLSSASQGASGVFGPSGREQKRRNPLPSGFGIGLPWLLLLSDRPEGSRKGGIRSLPDLGTE